MATGIDSAEAKPKAKSSDQHAEAGTPDATASAIHRDLPEIHGPSASSAALKKSDSSPAPKAPDAVEPATKKSPETAPDTKARLDQKLIDSKAGELHTALSRRSFVGMSSPDAPAVTDALS